jgi:hypothetical protein
MDLLSGAGIVFASAGVAIAAMLLVRRRAPAGGYFNDGDRAAGVFGVLATGFSVLLGFIVFLAFSSYDAARIGAETEALVVAQQVETAQFFAPAVGRELTGELVCYARSVAGPQWERMQAGTLGEELNPWGVELFHTLQTAAPATVTEEVAYGKWLDQSTDRTAARDARIHGAVGVIPSPLWIVIFFVASVIFGFMLFFADSEERPVVQGLLIGSVTAVITAMLLLLQFFDDPFRSGIGGLQPSAMERTIDVMEQELAIIGDDDSLPCNDRGEPVDAPQA